MLRRDAGKSVSICDGFRKRSFFHLGRGFVPLLAVMLLATPQSAFAQGSLAVTVNPRSLDITEEQGGTATDEYKVVFDAAPSDTVMVRVVGASGNVTVSPDELEFTTENWDQERTVMVTVAEDADAVSETVVLTHTATVGDDEEEVALSNTTVTVRITDTDDRGVTVDPTLLTVPESGDPVMYEVSLDTEPTGNVTVDVGGATGEITVSPSRLIFTPSEYDAKMVEVFAGEDGDALDDTAKLTHLVRGGDYTGEFASSVDITVDDNDEVGVTVSPSSLNIGKGARDTYSIVLTSQPTRSVTVRVTEDSNDVSVSPSSMTFSSTSWDDPRTVRVTVSSSAAAPGSVQITHTASSSDSDYDEFEVAAVNVSYVVDQPRVTLSRSTLRIGEGADGTYTVRLAAEPALATVNVDVEVPSGAGHLTVDPTRLTFAMDAEAENAWNKTQTVTVSADEDPDAVDDVTAIAHRVGATTVNATEIVVTVDDNDSRGVTVDPTSLTVNEGASGSYSVVLDTEPTGDVTVTITGASGDVTVTPSQLTFVVAANDDDAWFKAQTVTVKADEDPDGEPDPAVTLSHTVRGADYAGTRVSSVTVTVQEDEMRGVAVDMSDLAIGEGASATYKVELTAQPTGTVTVMVRGASGDVTVSPSRLVFTTSNWNESKDVEVKVGEDADGENDAALTLTHVASGGGYNGVSGGEVTVTTTDNDPKGVTVSPRALTVTEGSSASMYTVVLKTEPTGPVTITLGGLDVAKAQSLIVSPTSLTFTARNWNVPQRVTVRASEDSDGAASPVPLSHTASGGGYDNLPQGQAPLPVTVTIRDDDMAGVTVTPTSLQIAEGSSKTYTVVLNTQPEPDTNVTVTVGGASGDVSANPTELVFTDGNWDTPRTVTVHVRDDDTEVPNQEETVRLTHTVTGYSGVLSVSDVIVTVKDNDAPGVVINPTSLSITEGESGTYSVVLTKRPSTTVTVEVSGATGDVRVNTTRVRFTTGDWNSEKTVRVSVSEDDDAVQDAGVTLIHEVTGSDDDYVDPENPVRVSNVTVTPVENDEPGVTVDPTSLTIAAGLSETYTVSLNTEPTDAVTVMVTSPSGDVTVSGSPLIFTTSNWRNSQTVTVNVSEDAGGDKETTVLLKHTVTGGDYPGVLVSDVTVKIPVEGAPGAPTRLSATDGDRSVTLSWSAPADDGGSAIVRYQYRYQPSGGSFTQWAAVPGGASATSYTVTGLENGTSYTFEVRAMNAISPGQGATARATLAESAPGAPAGLTATGGDESVTLTWNAPTDGGSQILRYEFRYAADGETYGEWMTVSGGASARSLTIDNLTNGTEYGFQVRAVNAIDPGPAAGDSATPGRAPSMPTGLAASVESESITVMWGMPADDGGSAITRYEVRYRMSGGQWFGWMTVAGGGSATSHTIMDLTNGIGYEIAVRAVNGIDPGPAASVEATPMEGITFAHFANGQSNGLTITSDIVLVNVETSTVTPAIYFYNGKGDMIDAQSVVDVMGDLAIAGDGALTVPMGVVGRAEITITTNGEGSLVGGSVRVFATGRMGGVLRFDVHDVAVAGVGASEPVNDAIFPARRMAGGIRTGAAIRNLSAEPITVTCQLMQGGEILDSIPIPLAVDDHHSQYIDELFPGSNTTDFEGSVRCTAPDGGMFAGVALELDAAARIFTTLPLVPYDADMADDGISTLTFAHFANGDVGGVPTTSDLVFVNVANTAVAPVIYFYDGMGEMIPADSVVDVMMGGVEVNEDGALMVSDEIPTMGEMTISTTGMGTGVSGSVRVVSDGPIGGVLRYDIADDVGVAGVGASEAVNAAIFPARRMADGINTGVAIRNLDSEATTVTCRLMADGRRVRMGETPIDLAVNGQRASFIDQLFPDADTEDFEGSVHCAAPEGSMFTGVALEMDFNNRIFTTLPVIPVP